MYKRVGLIFLAVLVLILFLSQIIFADELDKWKGYGFYLLSKDNISIVEEDANLYIADGRLNFNGQYTIKNNTSKNNQVAFGIPNNGISNIMIKDQAAALKWRWRTLKGIKSEFGIDTTIPQEPDWYSFYVNLKAGESKVVSVSYKADISVNDENIYTISYLNDRNSSYTNNAEVVNLNLEFNNYKPYNIKEIEGFLPGDLNKNGILKLSYNSGEVKGLTIKFTDIDKLIIEKIKAVKNKSLAAIVTAYSKNDYEKTIALCEDYIKNPTDKTISVDQVKLLEVECFKELAKYDQYLKAIDQIDLSKVYPEDAQFKVLYDKLKIYEAQNDKANLEHTISVLSAASVENAKFLNSWLDINGYVIPTPTPTIVENTNVEEAAVQVEEKSFFLELYDKIYNYKYSLPIALLIGLFLGFIIGRLSKRKKRRNESVYLFRR